MFLTSNPVSPEEPSLIGLNPLISKAMFLTSYDALVKVGFSEGLNPLISKAMFLTNPFFRL